MSGCGGYEGHVMGACACGMYHSQANPFPMLYTDQNSYAYDYDESDMYSSLTPSSSSVDCTLSLGTPSTRLTPDEEGRRSRNERRRSVSNMCWDLLQSNQSHSGRSSRGGSSSSNDPLLARRCANCDTTSTPLWRNGPRGPKSLCNACGIRYKKEERRASAAAAAATASASGGVMEPQAMYGHQDNYWYGQSYSEAHRMPYYSPGMEEDGNGESDNGMPFLSWRLNVTDRPSLVHDFTG
ncbi:GATA transcription factor 19-like [Neltuma alba]|uniref:GATA transcription factor 19-like n=1 Tax=Neltuma alba TaxID=207710 RepID=UPI0010A49EEC|nr:GATA transcription factor 19-like [Prosopis alba]